MNLFERPIDLQVRVVPLNTDLDIRVVPANGFGRPEAVINFPLYSIFHPKEWIL